MASHEQRSRTTMGLTRMAIRSVLLLWLCSGLCVCKDEVPHNGFNPRGVESPDADQPEGVEDQLTGDGYQQADGGDKAAGGWLDGSPYTDAGSIPSQSQPEEGWGSGLAEDTSAPAVPVVPDDQESQTVKDESKAPREQKESSATEQPSTESEAMPVLSQKPAEPTSLPEELGDFVVRNGEEIICLRACFEALLKVDYVGENDDGTAVNRSAEIPVPAKADVGGFCDRDPSEQSALELQWGDGMYNLKITFRKQNATTKGDPNYWDASRIQFTFDTRDFYYFDAAVNGGPRTVQTSPKATFFATPQGNSRVCEAEDDIVMLPSAVDQTERVTIEISQLQMQPYEMVNGTFSEAVDCGEDLLENPNTNVASIAVGATLACLILVVIIVYAVGRKMGAINDRSGYKSVE